MQDRPAGGLPGCRGPAPGGGSAPGSAGHDGLVDVEATIYCEKDSHKGIIIGKGGGMLKRASTLARQDMEKFMGAKVFLKTWVKVKENWRDNPAAIQNFGYVRE